MSYMKDHLMDVATNIWKRTGCTWAEAMAKANGQDVEDCLSCDPALDNETWADVLKRRES